MHMKYLIQILITTWAYLTLLGCATTSENPYILPLDPNCATLVGKNFVAFIPQSKIKVRFYEVDGKEIVPDGLKGIPTEIPVVPGSRNVTVYLEAFGFITAQETIEIKVEAGRRYVFEPRNIGKDFDLVIREEGSDKIIYSDRISGNKGRNPTPIFIPIYN